MKLFRPASRKPLWQDEFSINRRRRTICQPAPVYEVPGADESWDVCREHLDFDAVVAPQGTGLSAAEYLPDNGCSSRQRLVVSLSNRKGRLHFDSSGSRDIRRLQPEVHASFVRRILRTGEESAGMPVPRGLFLHQRRQRPARSPTPTAAARRAGAARRATGRRGNDRERGDLRWNRKLSLVVNAD